MSAGGRLRLVFMGAPEFAAIQLRALLDAGHDVAAVYTQPPRPAGRGAKLRPTAVQALAAERGLEVRTPARLRGADTLAELAALRADLGVVVAYGLILPRAALDAPRLGCVNLHASLLPRWRGAAPIQRAIMAGDSQTGVAVMRMTEGLDEGPVIAAARTPIATDETAGTLHDKLAALGAPLLLEAIADLAAGRAVETPQPAEGALYAAKIDKAEARIDWSTDAVTLDRRIRGLSPSPGAWFERADPAGGPPERVKVLRSAVDPNGPPGRPHGAGYVTADGRLGVACGKGGHIVLAILQRAGKSESDADAYLRGRPLAPGERLS